MKRFVARALSGILNFFYHRYAHAPRRNLIVFLSRQSKKRSEDFKRLQKACGALDGWEVVSLQKVLGEGLFSKIGYAFHMISEARAIAQCRICFVEGYDLTLSMLELDGTDLGGDCVNHVVPNEPVVLQVWHAGGMFKKFGYQTLGSAEGRSVEDAQLFHMHRNYSWIVCSGEDARPTFAKAFGYPIERVVALGRPSCDALYESGQKSIERVRKACPQVLDEGKPVIVFAPTLRRTKEPRPFDSLRDVLEKKSWSKGYTLIWSDHPVMHEDRVLTTRDFMRVADLIVTDYSSVVYEAALLKLPFAFYIPDIEAYRKSPGLNTDPALACPKLSFFNVEDLCSFIDECTGKQKHYPVEQAEAFIGQTLSACSPGSTDRIVQFALDQVKRS